MDNVSFWLQVASLGLAVFSLIVMLSTLGYVVWELLVVPWWEERQRKKWLAEWRRRHFSGGAAS